MAHQDGRCATDAETIYVQNTAGCASASPGGGTATTPYCSLTPAIMALDAAHRVIVIRGAVGGSTSTIQAVGATAPLSIVGQVDAVVAAPGPQTILHVTGADVFIRGVAFKNSLDIGVTVDGGATIRLDTVTFDNNSKGGLLVDSSAFDIRNSLFTNNGPGDLLGLAWGGLRLQGLSSSGPQTLAQVTITGNKQVGLSCSSSISGTGVYAASNAGGVDISPTCGVTSCSLAGAGCGATP